MLINLDYTPQKYQVEFHKDTSRFRIICGGRRSGKTKCITQEIIKHCIEVPNALVFAVGPTYKLSREVLFEEFMTYYDQLEPIIENLHTSHMRVKFINGSLLYFKGSDKPDSLRGRGLTLYVADEAAFHKPDTWKLIVRPSLSDRQGKAILISTPNGRNWFYDIFKRKNWSSYHWTTMNNNIITEAEIEDAKSDMSEVDFKQEYLAEFITRAGRVYADFNDSNVIDEIDKIDLNKYDIYIGMDFGYATITCACLMGVNRYNNNVVMFDEIYVSHKQISEIILMITDMLAVHGINVRQVKAIYTDPAGNSEELTSGISPVDELRRANYNVINKATRINPGLALVRSFIKNINGDIRFKVTNNCKHAIRSFEGYQYNENRISKLVKEEPLKDGTHDHMCDAIRYFFVNKFDYAKYVAKQPEFIEQKQGIIKNKVWKNCGKCNKLFLSSTPKYKPPYICAKCNNEEI